MPLPGQQGWRKKGQGEVSVGYCHSESGPYIGGSEENILIKKKTNKRNNSKSRGKCEQKNQVKK